ncbi:MAG: hypothetical protein Q8R76_01330 [Candidatus Omnitrophota bacterium]|nr:hypothetical protein [Candidatus Omnitrophota bacterium]
MKKIAIFLAILLVAGSAPGWSLSATVDNVIDGRMKSDIHPIADAGLVLNEANKGIDTTYHAVTDPLAPVLDPIRKIRDETVRYAKTAVNTAWDLVTLRNYRNK